MLNLEYSKEEYYRKKVNIFMVPQRAFDYDEEEYFELLQKHSREVRRKKEEVEIKKAKVEKKKKILILMLI